MKNFASHRPSILTSKDFAAEGQFVSIANAQDKFVEKSTGTYLIDPF